ncbi:T-cell leukemia homeobox protein 1 [Crotalus adamanteus]|uniref:T-cell leukemia homeobox protein 1 n=1 Tax=Crotalus adamanteus TaxID=8729 RepID=A0AAW1BFF6_CROAD
MDHLGAHHLHPSHAEPISFGIDQILNNPDQGSCMISNARLQEAADYGLGGCVVSSAYNPMSGHYGSAPGGGGSSAAGGYGNGGACSMASLAGSYNLNVGVGAMNGNNLNAAGGVIRVPAHRPVAGGVPQPLPTAVPNVNNLTGLTFPWMESNRRYTKDRFTVAGACQRCPRCLPRSRLRKSVRCVASLSCPPARESRAKTDGQIKAVAARSCSLTLCSEGSSAEFNGSNSRPVIVDPTESHYP